MRHTTETLLTRLDTIGYPMSAAFLRTEGITGWTWYAVQNDIRNSTAHGATRGDVYRALRVINAIARRF